MKGAGYRRQAEQQVDSTLITAKFSHSKYNIIVRHFSLTVLILLRLRLQIPVVLMFGDTLLRQFLAVVESVSPEIIILATKRSSDLCFLNESNNRFTSFDFEKVCLYPVLFRRRGFFCSCIYFLQEPPYSFVCF